MSEKHLQTGKLILMDYILGFDNLVQPIGRDIVFCININILIT